MSKQIAFSKSLPLPAMVTREVTLSILHNHGEMARLNPQVVNHRSIQPPRGVSPNEASAYKWYELSEDISHLSMGTARAIATYKVCYRNLDNGVDFHVYGPQGLDVKEQWTITDVSGLALHHSEVASIVPGKCVWLRRDCNVSSISVMSPLTEKNLYRAHQVFEEQAVEKCLPPRHPSRPKFPFTRTSSLGFSRLSSRNSMRSCSEDSTNKRSSMISMLDPSDTHPAFRDSINWSLVSDSASITPSPRTSSLSSRSSKSPANSLKRRSYQSTSPRQSSEATSRSSYAESARSSIYAKRPGTSSTFYSGTSSLPPSPIPDESAESQEPKPHPVEYKGMGGNPFHTKLSHSNSVSSSSGSSTPSLTEESSDDEPTTPTEELQTPIDSASAAQIFEAMQKHHFSTRSTSPCPPPVPEKADARLMPQPLSVRPQSVVSCYDGTFTFPLNTLPDTTSSMKRCSSRQRPFKTMGWSNPQKDLRTDETEQMLDLANGNGFSIYG